MRNYPALMYGLLVVGMIGCGKGDKPGDNKPGDNKAAVDPRSKEAAVIVLKEFYKAANDKEYEKAATFFHPAGDFDFENPEKRCLYFMERKEISPKGIDILVEKGKWGQLIELAKAEGREERVKDLARNLKVEPDSLYGLMMEGRDGSALFAFDGKQFKLVKIDDIGKLEGPPPVRPTPPPGERFTGRIVSFDPDKRIIALKGSVGKGKEKGFANREFKIPNDVPVTATGGKVKIPAKSLFKYLKNGMLLDIRYMKGEVLGVEVREEIKLDE